MQGPVIRGTGYEGEGVYRRMGKRVGGEFLRFVPFLTHVQLHNSIVASIRTLLSLARLSASSLRRRAVRWVGEVRFNELSQTRF